MLSAALVGSSLVISGLDSTRVKFLKVLVQVSRPRYQGDGLALETRHKGIGLEYCCCLFVRSFTRLFLCVSVFVCLIDLLCTEKLSERIECLDAIVEKMIDESKRSDEIDTYITCAVCSQ